MSKQILLVEDNYSLRRLYSKALDRAGFNVYDAASLDIAYDALETQSFDLIVCDIQMGNDLSFDIIPLCIEQQIPVVAMSSEYQYRQHCEDLGVDLFIQKPIPMKQFVEAIQDQLALVYACCI